MLRKWISKLLGTPEIKPTVLLCKSVSSERVIIRANGKREVRGGYYHSNLFKHIWGNIKLVIKEMRDKGNANNSSN